MSKRDPMSGDINSKIKIPKIAVGLSETQAKAQVNTNWKDIKWTKKKLLFVSIGLGLPYLLAILVSFLTRIYLITGILVFLGIFIALLVVFARWIDKSDDF